MLLPILSWTLAASLITAGLYVWDKRAATRNNSRISESTLLSWSAVGGWPGGWLAGRTVRHKTQKTTYRIKFAIAVALHIMACGAILYYRGM